METITGWIALFLIVYISIALFYVAGGAKKVLKLTVSGGEFQVEASTVLRKSYRTRFLWVKKHKGVVPPEARNLAIRVVTVEYSCWASLFVLFILYGLNYVVL
ncbi:MAG: hypothetical protein A2W28_01250 [Gammaproteobacteria bacterium RBG_16_51_14]|nr:MAG: hypothetical protein A2W28_01250 [Gammaproteobacteria bacterium RBG_16_51_14]